ncbi:MAG TPA: long-chain fatty acid--CoA ligase [Candidatus Obscuribacterales bacterium]
MNSISVSSQFPPLPELSGGVAEVLSIAAARQPDKTAVIYQGEKITYQRLFARAQTISSALARVGIIQGDKVGVLFPNHPDFVAAFFAVCGLGATVVPINPLLKSEEIQHILHDSDAKALLVHEDTMGEVGSAVNDVPGLEHVFVFAYDPKGKEINLPLSQSVRSRVTVTQFNCSYMSIDGLEDVTSGWTKSLRREEDLAVLVYTSGTTGKPKGAMLSHHNVLSAVEAAQAVFPVASEDKMLACLPLCHIYGLSVVMIGMIAKGGTIVIIEKFEAKKALEVMEQERVTILPAVPAMYQFIVMELNSSVYDLSHLRLCLSGGAPLPVEMYDALARVIKAPLVEGYGLTETSCASTLNPVNGKAVKGSVGLPLPGVKVAILGPDGSALPRGSAHVGEIAIKGPNVMRGYYRRPDTTQEILKDGWLLTGDLGYIDEEGYIFIVGRSKELIIRGGQNIYPREIENAIVRMKDVIEAAVVGVPDQYMGERVKAVVVLKPGSEASEQDVKDHCAKLLAEYKVPRIVEFVEALPRNSTGKVLKRLLV